MTNAYARKTGVLTRRRAGVLLHISSLPSASGQGTLGSSAYRFIDFLADAGFSVWQTLPLGPVGDDLSPYNSASAHAGNSTFIDIDFFRKNIEFADAALFASSTEHRCWSSAVDGLCQHFFSSVLPSSEKYRHEYHVFCAEHAFWLKDYALFASLKEYHDGKPWNQWHEPYRNRDETALQAFSAEHHTLLERVFFEQFIFYRQWQKLRDYAHQRGVFIFGDIPIFVAHDSADVWAHQRLFQLDLQGNPVTVAGVPPDYFSDSGQHWGNPHYRWEAMAAENFAWWIQRFATQQKCFDVMRVDHFRGFEAFWEIPWPDQDARRGWWTAAPGEALLQAVFESLPGLELVAENLGVITPEVELLRKSFGMAGMAVLQFGFDENPHNPHLLHEHEKQQVVYTGTHDNAPIRAWYDELDRSGQERVRRYLLDSVQPLPWLMVKATLSSVATLAIIPMQDLLGAGGEARMNMPGTVGNNWQWQFSWEDMPQTLTADMRAQIQQYGR